MSECCYLGLLVLEVGLEVSPQPFDGLGLLDALPVDGQLGRVLLHGDVRLKSEKHIRTSAPKSDSRSSELNELLTLLILSHFRERDMFVF